MQTLKISFLFLQNRDALQSPRVVVRESLRLRYAKGIMRTFNDLLKYPLPKDVWVVIPHPLGLNETIRHDGRGNALRYVHASQLQERLEVPENAWPSVRAMKAYIDQLPGDTPVILFAH